MNELNARLLEYLPDPNTVKGGLGGIVETMQAEAPLLVNEILRWHFAKSFCICLAMVASSLVILFISKAVWKFTKPIIAKENQKNYPDCFGYYLLRALPLALSVVPIIVIFINAQWLQIWIAPRLFMLEYISNLLT